MYDFCITPLYAGLLAIGGVAGYFTAGSAKSLIMGVVGAVLLGILSWISMKYYEQGKLCKPSTGAQWAITAGVTGVMYKRYAETGKIFPAGLVLVISMGMLVFLAWCMAAGPVPKKKASQ